MKSFQILLIFISLFLGISSVTAEEKQLMLPDSQTLEAIRENVNLAKTVLGEQLGVKLDLDESSIKWIDEYINRNRDDLEKHTRERLIDIFGSFLGESIIKNYGGTWALNNGALAVHLKGESWAFPFSKVEKQMYQGPEDSIYSFYTIIPMLLDGSLSKKSE
jgi:hypothetical protein